MINSVQKFFLLLVLLLSPVLFIQQAHAAKAVDHTGWKVDLGGYVDLDAAYDNTRSFTEVPNNGPVIPGLSIATAANGGSINGDNPRYQQSARNTRFRVFVVSPDENDWKVSGQLETDFNGYDPAPQGPTGGAQSEQNFYTAGTLRLRLAYAEMENWGLKFKVGQAWSLFGWQPYYEIANLQNDSLVNVLNRTPLLQIGKDFTFGDDHKLETAIAFSRSSERDSAIPDFTIAANYSWAGRKAGFLPNFHTQMINAPASLGIGGTFKQFSTPNVTTGLDSDRTQYYGGGGVADILIPVLTPTTDGTFKNSVTLLGEFARGAGLLDQYPSFTSGLAAFTGTGTTPNLDAGFGGYDSNGNFNLVQTQSFTAQLQYVAPTDNELVVNVAYANLHSSNAPNLYSVSNPGAQVNFGTTGFNQATYDQNELYSITVSYSLTKSVRVAGEFDKMFTHYINGVYPVNNRLQTSVFYMF